MIFDQDHMDLQEKIDEAFKEGARYGRQRSDEDLVDLMTELRVSQARECAAHYREGLEVGALLTILGVAVIVCAGLFAWWLT